MDFFIKYSDKFTFTKASDIMVVMVVANIMLFNIDKYKNYSFNISINAEITIECNPDDLTLDKLKIEENVPSTTDGSAEKNEKIRFKGGKDDAGKSLFGSEHKLSSIWDNEIMQGLDKWNNKVDQEYLPNYYSEKETNADWYDRDNWMTTNFLFDKVIKNAGFAVGAVAVAVNASRSIAALVT